MSQRNIDLHCHSLFSDGTFSPEELVAEAKKANLAALALTDHDNYDGWPRLLAAGQAAGLEVVPGIEISTLAQLPDGKSRRFDLLAYLFDPEHPEFCAKLEEVRTSRATRNDRMVEKLAGMGVHIQMSRLKELAGGRVVGRPHFARAMMEGGYIAAMDDAFEGYLEDDGPAYVPKMMLSTIEAIQLARRAGGVCSLAHPGEVPSTDPKKWRPILAPLVEAGLAGLECLYPGHNPEQTRVFKDLAREFELVVTGGSDFHGANRLGVYLGTGRGTLQVPYAALEGLRGRKAADAAR